MERLVNLTERVEVMEIGGLSYSQLDFELVKLEIKEMEALILQLKTSMNGSNALVEALYQEHGIQGKHRVTKRGPALSYPMFTLVTSEDIAGSVPLQKRLEDCEKNQTRLNPNPLLAPMNYGKCDHGGIVNISKPSVVQLNWLGFNYKYGGWGSDSFLGVDKDIQFVAPLNTDSRRMDTLRFYNTYNDLLIYKHKEEKVLPVRYDYSKCGQGGGMIMYNKSLYYNCYDTQNLCKLNLQTNAVERKVLTNAAYNNRFSYSSSAWQDIDLASDEDGLWVIYATEADGGNILIGKLNSTNLELMQTWSTTQYKRGVTNAFMVCGVLYATRALSTKQEEIFYMYDTKTSKEAYLSVTFDKMMENMQSLSNNPNDHKLYMFNDGYLLNYDLNFKELK
ncbi:unnamed protein product [Ranitomeya imitator]|uniref:Olfactomedin-like domain-containing protein n=1 Tax=Ranitomeya imitator TaxID=111125 RepID=A0ABN9M5I0_9NEOB|nr:unnamed protein product [Ranitomeya imitator]